MIEKYLLIFSVIKKIERVGDQNIKIGEVIIVYLEAEVLKQRKKKGPAKQSK